MLVVLEEKKDTYNFILIHIHEAIEAILLLLYNY